MFGSVNSESSNTQVDEVVHVVHDLLTDVFIALVQVLKTRQLAVTYPISAAAVVVALNDTVGPVEVVPAIRHARVAPVAEVGGAATGTSVLIPCACHVVDDGIDVDSDTSVVTFAHHVSELLFVTGAGDKAVGDGLVTFPPGALARPDGKVLIGRRDLNTTISSGS